MIPIKRHFEDGDMGPGVRCKGCGAGIAIASDLTTVPQQFQATCPRCGHADKYEKSEVRTFVARKKQ
jgi:uncharacterized paraquat-inducible protein A